MLTRHGERLIALVDTIKELANYIAEDLKIDMTNREEVEALLDLYHSHGFSKLTSITLIHAAKEIIGKVSFCPEEED